MKDKLNIGFITCHFPPDSIGGGQVQSFRLCSALGKRHTVNVYSRDYSNKALRSEKTANFNLYRRKILNIIILRSLVDLFSGIREVRNSKNKTDIYISFHIQLASLIVVLSRLIYGITAVVSPQGFEDFDFHGIKKYFQTFIYNHSSAILIQAETIRDVFLENCRKNLSKKVYNKVARKIYIFPNGIELNESITNTYPEENISLVYIGRLVNCKGIEYLIEACKSFPKNYVCTFVGDGANRKHLEKLSTGLSIKYVGEKQFWEIENYLKEAHVLVLPSLTENLPNVVLEALAAGVPVIASKVGAIPEIITDGVNGFLVSPKCPKEITASLERLFSSKECYNKIKNQARNSVVKYTWEALLPQLESSLKTIARNYT